MLPWLTRVVFPAKGKYAGGNPVCPRPTPDWQKGIGDFFGGPGRIPEKENQLPPVEEVGEAGGSGTAKAGRRSDSAHLGTRSSQSHASVY